MRTCRANPLLKKTGLEAKIKKLSDLEIIVSKLKSAGKKIVFTNGCFDLLHYGHVKYLEDAKRKGDALIVAVNSDSSVRKIKGSKRPLVSQNDRARIIAALESVDYVTVFTEVTPLKVITLLKPDVLIKGADWKKNEIVGSRIVKLCGGKITTVKLAKGRSSTKLIKKIAGSL